MIEIQDTLEPKNGGKFPVAKRQHVKGAPQIVADITERDDIPAEIREIGMEVSVISESYAKYRLEGGILNTNWQLIPGSSTSDILGMPTSGDWTNSFLGLTSDTKKTDAIYYADQMFARLAPPKPADLGTKVIVMATYNALRAATGVSDVCTDDNTPTGSVAAFGDGAAGTLSAEIDGVAAGSKVLVPGSDIGSYDSMNITADVDPYAGQPGKEGIYKQLDANITALIALSIAQHTYQLKHSRSGNTPVFTFFVDDPTTSSITNAARTLPASNVRYVSGVPSLAVGDNITMAFRVLNAVRSHYNATRLARLTGNEFNALDVNPASIPALNSFVDFSNVLLPVLTSRYTEGINVVITPYNSKNVAGNATTVNTGARIDTVSDESARKISGSGDYPASGYGSNFISSSNLKTVYTNELQMLNGRYQWPSGNYISNAPTAGPDYSSGMGASDRWVTFKPVTLNNSSGFTLEILSALNFSGIETSGIKIFIKVEGATGWLNANAAYGGVGNPTNDGNACMVYNQSDTDTKRVTFGSIVRSGDLYIRIGLPAASNKSFAGIQVTNIV